MKVRKLFKRLKMLEYNTKYIEYIVLGKTKERYIKEVYETKRAIALATDGKYFNSCL